MTCFLRLMKTEMSVFTVYFVAYFFSTVATVSVSLCEGNVDGIDQEYVQEDRIKHFAV